MTGKGDANSERLVDVRNKIAFRNKASAHDFISYGGNYSPLTWNSVWAERIEKESNTAISSRKKWAFMMNDDTDSCSSSASGSHFDTDKLEELGSRPRPRSGFRGSRPISSAELAAKRTKENNDHDINKASKKDIKKKTEIPFNGQFLMESKLPTDQREALLQILQKKNEAVISSLSGKRPPSSFANVFSTHSSYYTRKNEQIEQFQKKLEQIQRSDEHKLSGEADESEPEEESSPAITAETVSVDEDDGKVPLAEESNKPDVLEEELQQNAKAARDPSFYWSTESRDAFSDPRLKMQKQDRIFKRYHQEGHKISKGEILFIPKGSIYRNSKSRGWVNDSNKGPSENAIWDAKTSNGIYGSNFQSKVFYMQRLLNRRT